METADETLAVESGIEKLVRWCGEGKVEIRAYDKSKIHAKLYIFSFAKEQLDKGRVITGSSNLSQSGLQDNLEFNVELKTRSDYDFALQKFEDLWGDSVEVSQDFVRAVEEKSHLAQFSPRELYLKLLYEYFQNELTQIRELDEVYYPEEFLRLQYQHDAVLTAKRIVEELNGVFIADVVGLGKTYMAAMLARELEGGILVIAPPALIDEKNPGAWGNVFRDFGVRRFKTYSVGRLDEILKLDLRKFQYVFIDEAHRFRNEYNETYAKLHRICRNKKIVLVTATPFNNRPTDLLSQLKLFQNSRNSTIPNLPNLDNFFRRLNSNMSGLHRVRDRETYRRAMRENAHEVRERILKHLMVRRTRTEISTYYGEDLAKQGLKFPEVETPTPVFYELSPTENRIFTETIRRVSKEIKYARYRPLVDIYFKGQLDDDTTTAQNNLAAFMKILLVKRLESSFAAFRITVDKFIDVYSKYIKAYRNGYVYVSKKKTSLIFDLLDANDLDAIERLIEDSAATRYDADNFEPAFLADLESDLTVLKLIHEDWQEIRRDPKWQKFKALLQNDAILKESKLLIFTESKDTAEYLSGLIDTELKEKTICFSGSSKKSSREEVIQNFDARVRKPKDNYRILVTTDALAEGVSLHRSNVVLNYDIPWNPTRMMQRVGRINRVDTKFDKVYTYNFFPSDEGENEIGLQAAAEAKIEAFIEMLGSDAALLTENEEIKSFNLFDRLTSKATITGEDEEESESELKFLTLIRDIQENDKDLFARIKALPKKARSAQRIGEYADALLTYFRIGKLDKFYLSTRDKSNSTELDFLQTAKLLESESDEKRHVGSEFYSLLIKNQMALSNALKSDEETKYTPAASSDVYTKLRRRLLAFKSEKMIDFTDSDDGLWQDAILALEHGSIAKKTVNRVWKLVEKTDEAKVILDILRKNFDPETLGIDSETEQRLPAKPREVILSEYFL
ncbi:MAG: helicase-related protein [Pyrinomonadaceae bacterium]